MVNGRFLIEALYDFERLDARASRGTRQANNAKPKTCGRGTEEDFFREMRRELSSPQSLGLYRELQRAARLCEPEIAKRSTNKRT